MPLIKKLEREYYEGIREITPNLHIEFYDFKLQIKCASVPRWLDYCTIKNIEDAKLAKEKALDGTGRFRIVTCGNEEVIECNWND